MNQKQNSSNQGKYQLSPIKISFKQTIKKLEFNSFKQEFQRKKQISTKSKLKELWLERIKIVPPNLNRAQREKFFRATDSFSEKDNDCFKMFRHNHFKKDAFDEDIELLFQNRIFQISSPLNGVSHQGKLQRRSHNPAFQSPKCNLRGRKLKQNWKLEHRRDQMNVLRFSTASPKQRRLLKTADFGQLMSGVEEIMQKEQRPSKLICKHMINLEEEQNKENLQQKIEYKKEERKFRLNVKKGKTSLVLKKSGIL